MSDPRRAATLDEASLNTNGKTYNGARALSWLSEALFPGHGLSEDEVKAEFEKVKASRKKE